MKQTLTAVMIFCVLALMPMSSSADEAKAKLQIETIAMALVPNLSSDKKVVLKTISPEDSGLPADFLRKLTSDLEAALLVASEFEINLVNRQTTEEIWAEAIEFNNADFGALHAASGASVVLMLTARATEGGVEVALTAYSLDAADAGRVVTSSGSTLLALDMKQNVGVDVNSLNDQMEQVLAEIEKVGQTGGLISDPNTYAEYYHNARLLQQKGETDLAISNYEQSLKFDLQFVDPVLDLLKLVSARFSKEASKLYFEKRIIPFANDDIRQLIYVAVMLENDDEAITRINSGEINFPPALAYWLRGNGKKMKAYRDGDVSYQLKIPVDSALLKASREVQAALKNQSFATYFIDNLVSVEFAEESSIDALVQEMNRAYVLNVDVGHVYRSSNEVNITPLICSFSNPSFVFDSEGNPIDLEVQNVDFPLLGDLVRAREEMCIKNVGDLSGETWYSYASKSAYNISVRGQKLDKLSLENLPSKFIDHEGFTGLPCQLAGIADVQVSPPKSELRDPFNEDEYLVHLGEFAFQGTEISVSVSGNLGDYAVYGDACIDRFASELNLSVKDGDTFKLPYLAGLTITDSVDTTRPILLYYTEIFGDGAVDPSDITKDGTFISQYGPTSGGGNGEFGYEYRRRATDWLFVPGYLQSSILQTTLKKIVYFNKFGEEIVLTNIEFVPPDNSSLLPENYVYLPDFFTTNPSIQDQIEYYASSNSADITLDRLVDLVSTAFNELSDYDRRQLQADLRGIGAYQGEIDGVWGPGVEGGIRAYFTYIDQHLPDRSYLNDHGLNDGISPSELVIFFKHNATCVGGSYLQQTPACN